MASITITTSSFGAINSTLTGQAPATITLALGVPGPGVVAGGTTNQILAKKSSTNYDTQWVNPVDIAASWGNITGTLSAQTDLQNALNAKLATSTAASTYYLQTNPAGYITSSALSPYLLSLTAASTYYPLSGNPSGFLTSASLSGYATQSWVTSQGYITSSALSPYETLAHAASTYAPIAAGQPTSGTVGQVLTKASGTNYDSYWATPVIGDKYYTTSTTSLAIGTGTKSLTVGTGLSYTTQQTVIVAYDAANHMHAIVTSYNSSTGAMVISVSQKSGSGTYSSWTVNVGGVISGLWGSITGTLSDQTDLQTALNAKLDSATASSTYAPLASPTFTGTVTIPAGATITGYATTSSLSSYAPLASPSLTGTPLSTTAAADTNTTQIATTAFVVGQASATTPVVDGTATVGTSLKYARADHVHPTDTSRAALASPTFTGVPLAPTATAGTNTTQIATTAFVTAAVPAIASFAESQQLTSTTKAMSPFDVGVAMMTEGYRPAMLFTSATSGTGAGAGLTTNVNQQLVGPNTATAGYAYAMSVVYTGFSTSSSSNTTVLFNKPIWISGTFDAISSSWQGDANTELKVYLGSNMTNGDDPNAACIGWWKLGGASTPFNLMVHNGTTLTKVASASNSANSGTPYRWMIYSDGSGNVTLYINGTSVATTSSGPAGATQSNICSLTAAVKATASSAARVGMDLLYPKLFIAPQ